MIGDHRHLGVVRILVESQTFMGLATLLDPSTGNAILAAILWQLGAFVLAGLRAGTIYLRDYVARRQRETGLRADAGPNAPPDPTEPVAAPSVAPPAQEPGRGGTQGGSA